MAAGKEVEAEEAIQGKAIIKLTTKVATKEAETIEVVIKVAATTEAADKEEGIKAAT